MFLMQNGCRGRRHALRGEPSVCIIVQTCISRQISFLHPLAQPRVLKAVLSSREDKARNVLHARLLATGMLKGGPQLMKTNLSVCKLRYERLFS